MGETPQMTSGTLNVFAYLRFVQMRRRHSIVGEPSEEHRDGKAGKTGGPASYNPGLPRGPTAADPFLSSSRVEHPAVNRRVVGSNPT